MEEMRTLLILLSQVLLISGQLSTRRCYTMSDMIFTVSTSNQDALVADQIKNQITEFISRQNILQNETRVALVTSGRLDPVTFYLDSLPDNKTARMGIGAAPYITDGNPANLTWILDEVLFRIVNTSHGDRENITNLHFIITDQSPADYDNNSLEFINNIKNKDNILFFIATGSLDDARRWSPYATETDFVMDLENMGLLATSISPYLHWDCHYVKPVAPPRIDPLCLNETCSNCRLSGGDDVSSPPGGEGHVVICSCGSAISSKYCYTRQPEETTVTSRARCRTGEGVTEVTRMSIGGACSSVRVDTVCPGFGPESGGTDVYVWGEGFSSSVKKAYLWPFPCQVVYSNNTFIHCVSSPIEGTDAHFSYLSLQVETSNGCKVRTRGAFAYYHNPRIKRVQPTTSLVSGGFSTTVTGENLNNVANIVLEITAMYEDIKQMFISECSLVNETTAECVFPEMYLPGIGRQRAKRSTAVHQRAKRSATGHQRAKRSIVQERSEQQEGLKKYKFYIGFKMDGVKSYKNMSKVSSTDAFLTVYLDPLVEKFPEEEGRFILNYRPGWPDKMSFITIRGLGLASTPGGGKLNVTLGSGVCDVTDVTDEYIVCIPPEDEPVPASTGDLHLIQIQMQRFRMSPGYVRYDTSLWNNTTSRSILIVVILLAVLLVIFLTVVGVICLRKRKRKKNEEKDWMKENGYANKDLTRSDYSEYLMGEYLDPHTTLQAALSGELKAKVEDCRLHPEKVKKEHLISRGAHGLIYTGWLLNENRERLVKVKIKTYDHDVPFRHIREFLEEATQLKGLEHENVVCLAGVVLGDRIPSSVAQYAEHGDLKGYLMKARKHPEDLSMKQKMEFCIDICRGMNFICDSGIVHEDLAARNRVVDADMRVRVADSTLSRDLYELDYYRPGEKARALPVKWMPPEALEHQLFSSKGDVWSFGVLIWEVFTLAATPYPEIQNSDMRKHIRTGTRLEKPETTPVALYKELLHCWAKEPNKRPNFSELTRTLRDVSSSKPALSKTSLLPLDHFAIPDATTSATIDTGVTLDNDVTNTPKNVTSSNDDVRNKDGVIISKSLGDTKL